jgi:hypothetical protein
MLLLLYPPDFEGDGAGRGWGLGPALLFGDPVLRHHAAANLLPCVRWLTHAIFSAAVSPDGFPSVRALKPAVRAIPPAPAGFSRRWE